MYKFSQDSKLTVVRSEEQQQSDFDWALVRFLLIQRRNVRDHDSNEQIAIEYDALVLACYIASRDAMRGCECLLI